MLRGSVAESTGILLALYGTLATAEVVDVNDGGFHIRVEASAPVSKAGAWKRFVQNTWAASLQQ